MFFFIQLKIHKLKEFSDLNQVFSAIYSMNWLLAINNKTQINQSLHFIINNNKNNTIADGAAAMLFIFLFFNNCYDCFKNNSFSTIITIIFHNLKCVDKLITRIELFFNND